MVAVAATEILYVGQIRSDYMREQPIGYVTFQSVVMVFALLVGVLNLKGSPTSRRYTIRATGRALGGLILGCSIFPAEPIARWIQNTIGYHPSHNFVIFILMLTLSILGATVVERSFRRIIRSSESGEPSDARGAAVVGGFEVDGPLPPPSDP